jgi:hypothetical protein
MINFLIASLLFLVSGASFAQIQNVVPGKYTPGFYTTPNFVKNPNCFANNRNISVSGTGTVSRTTTTPLEASASCSIAGASSGDRITFDTNTFDKSLRGQNCELRIVYQGDASKWQLYARSGSTAVSQVKALTNTFNTALGDYDSATASIPYSCGDLTSATVPAIEATASSPATFKVTAAYIGLLINGAQQVNNISAWQSYTPTITGFGTATNIEFQWRQVGENVEIRGKFTSGTTTATEARVSLPNSYTSAGTSKIPSLQAIGKLFYSGTGTGFEYSVLTEPSVGYVTFGSQDSARSALTKANASVLGVSGNAFALFASVPVSNLGASASIYTASNADTDWAACTPSGHQGFGASPTYDLQCKRNGGDLLIMGKVTATSSTAVEARINFPMWNGAQLTSKGTSVIPTIRKAGEATLSAVGDQAPTVLIEPSVSYMTFGFQGASAAGLTKQTASNWIGTGTVTFSLNARIPIEGWQNSNVMIASVSEANITVGIQKPEFFSFNYGTTNATTVCSASPCSYLDQIGSAVSSVTRATPSGTQYTINLSKTWSKLKCLINSQGATTENFQKIIQCSSCSSVSFQTTNNADSANVDSYGVIFCHGYAP